VDGEAVFDAEDIALAEWMAAYYLCGRGQALAAMIPSGRRADSFPSLPDEDDIAPAPLDLSEEQSLALNAITAAIDKKKEAAAHIETGPERGTPPSLPLPPMFYLYGITGSGKT
jgi:primosomal protein N' (replication factor Y)